ncbi:conserved hypothetical protein [Enhydrobacter sp. 8BJ]|nr:hypothetical protein [Enhydrobacter sp. 8BJ]VXA96689.1 conserved hypothetical protein [Enhydrobacter sp. 8BJ]
MSGVNLEQYRQLIEHKKGQGEAKAESCPFFAYQIDGNNGLSVGLEFKEGQISQADYVLIDKQSNEAQILEITDLSNAIRECLIAESIAQEEIKNFAREIGKSDKKATKLVNLKIWYEVIGEIKNKWYGSIAILERYCRIDNYPNNLNYSLVIVVKNSQDSRNIDSLKLKLKNLQPIMGNVEVIKTQNLENLLILKMV